MIINLRIKISFIWGLYNQSHNIVTSSYEPVPVPTPGNRERTIVGHGPTHGAVHVTPASDPHSTPLPVLHSRV